MAGAARIGDFSTGHSCYPIHNAISGSSDVIINGISAHRQGDLWSPHCYICGEGGGCHSSTLCAGSPTVLVNSRQAGRIGDPVCCGSIVSIGSTNVIIGNGGHGIPPSLGIATTPYANLEPFVVVINGDTLSYSKNDIRAVIEDTPEADPGPRTPPSIPSGPVDESPPPESPPDSTDCANLTTANPSFKLSTNFTLGQLSSSAIVSKTAIQPQHGLSLQDIACNLKALAENVLEPLRSHVGNRLVITSGFRLGSSSSQHEKGQAVDVQITNASNDEMWEIAKWTKNNINYDQFIYEYNGNRPWLHLSYNRAGNRPATASNKFGSKPMSGYIWNSLVKVA